MKLRNKRTGEIGNLVLNINPNRESFAVLSTEDGDTICGNLVIADYDSLAELNEEWEDVPEEPKEYWYIEPNGVIARIDEWDCCTENDREVMRLIGNYFDTREEAEKAVEKLKAWKRLKDKGFRVTLRGGKGNAWLQANWGNLQGDYSDVLLLFGGEE